VEINASDVPQMSKVVTLGDALPKEMARVRDEVMPAYQEIGAAGAMALVFMRNDLDRAARAMATGDVVAMLRAYEALKGYST
jgi:hypothetical protein